MPVLSPYPGKLTTFDVTDELRWFEGSVLRGEVPRSHLLAPGRYPATPRIVHDPVNDIDEIAEWIIASSQGPITMGGTQSYALVRQGKLTIKDWPIEHLLNGRRHQPAHAGQLSR